MEQVGAVRWAGSVRAQEEPAAGIGSWREPKGSVGGVGGACPVRRCALCKEGEIRGEGRYGERKF